MNIAINKRKVLTAFSLAMINVIAIDSLRNLPMNAEYGFSIITLYLLGTILFLVPCILVTAELATNYPKTGGSYIWVKEAFGERTGFLNAWLQWVYNVAWFPAILTFIIASMAYLINPNLISDKAFMIPMIIGIFTLATIFNCFGMKLSSWVSSFGAIVGTVIPMLFIIALGVGWLALGKPIAATWSVAALVPKTANLGDFSFVVVILFSLIGIELSAVHAGDVKNPKKDYPRALWMSGLFIVLSMTLSSLAITIILPKASINIVSGLNQAFYLFLHKLDLQWLMPVAILSIIIGGFAGMSAWIIGPTKALMVAAKDGCAPKFFGKQNRFGVPVNTLILQVVIVIVLCSLFLLFKTVSEAYWVLSDMTAQLALIYYIILFASAMKLRRKTPPRPDTFKIPGGNWVLDTVCVVGILTCITAIGLGFLPPSSVKITDVPLYEGTLIAGILIFVSIPLLISRKSRSSQKV